VYDLEKIGGRGAMSEEPEMLSDDLFVTCPCCGAQYQPESDEFNDREHEEECDECGKIFLQWDEVNPFHRGSGPCVIHYSMKKQVTQL
jgi:hypothetical protein